MAPSMSPLDPCSFSRPEYHVITHLDLDLSVNFEDRILEGHVLLSLDARDAHKKRLVLDIRDIEVSKILLYPQGQILHFTIEESVKSFGTPLFIDIPVGIRGSFQIKIYYRTSPNCTALQWLTPEQTLGKMKPYLFSQCQAIHARSLVPCQDTPYVKFTYTATLRTPEGLVALMSAVRTTDDSIVNNTCHTFEQKIKIPSYLLALVVGDIESRTIGPRSKVWCEKELVDAAAEEFSETEQMLVAAEELMGMEYVWGDYDILVLPPSFPYGGMENPCLTFVTPSLLAGDKSLADVVAHEISHSWTGNLVTNKNWEHFWLNEGHTRFVECKIVGKLRGEKSRQFHCLRGWNALKYTVEEQFSPDHAYTALVPVLDGVDPDDAFSSVPYEKGLSLLMYLEQQLGTPENFEEFLKAYIQKYKYKAISSSEWKRFLYEHFKEKREILDKVNWEGWFYKPGMPPEKPEYDYSLAEACQELADRWADADDDAVDSFTADDLKDMTSTQVQQFFELLLEKPPLSSAKVARLKEAYKLDDVKNSEVLFRWLRINILAKNEDIIPKALEFVNSLGRMKFVRPIYRDLYKWDDSRDAAVTNYKEHKLEMHTTTAKVVAKDLELSE